MPLRGMSSGHDPLIGDQDAMSLVRQVDQRRKLAGGNQVCRIRDVMPNDDCARGAQRKAGEGQGQEKGETHAWGFLFLRGANRPAKRCGLVFGE